MKTLAALLLLAGLSAAVGQELAGSHALFVRNSPSPSARQQSDPAGYLPPYTTQRPPERPRPFQTSTTVEQQDDYSYQRATSVQPPVFSSRKPTYLPAGEQSTARPGTASTYSFAGSSAFPSFPAVSSPRPSSPSYSTGGAAATTRGYATPSYGSSSFSTPGGFSSGFDYQTGGSIPSFGSTAASASTGYSYDQAAGYPSSPPYLAPVPDNQVPSLDAASGTSGAGALGPSETTGGAGTIGAGEGTGGTGTVTIGGPAVVEDDDDDSKHPPHIHALDVECSKTAMTINIEFNRVFDGVIYSKGFYANPACRYVAQNSGRTKYSFTVSLDSCGTQFINDFAGEAGQAYLENVLVLQNEPGIQEVWDTVRRVRCLWEGNISKALSVNLSVDMLNQEIATFSGDTAVAKLDIQVGRGPFAPAATGLVKIGETMTLVVSVEGDPAFDLQVRDCVARDESSSNVIQLTDRRGCILKPKLFGAFQKTNDTGNTGASIIAYAYFQAFKFPDVMDLFIECNVELCKTDCEPCPEGNQQVEPGRRRRRSASYTPATGPLNGTSVLLADPVRVARGFRVIMVDDLSQVGSQVLEQLEETAIEQVSGEAVNICMTSTGFYVAVSVGLTTVLLATIASLLLYAKLQRVYRSKLPTS